MAHQSLYRRYRPQRFSEVRGQDHLVGALQRAVAEERVGHAYLFSGPRGTGKTTTARILAKALNCSDLSDGEPCGVCDSCVAIADGTSFDLHELDAASKGGVDEMRALIETIALGTPGHFKVYILDEAHMLSPAASAALLKTLEEPPEHVIFVLATTHPQKVLPTIRSRTQHFDLNLLGVGELRSLVDDVSADAGLDLSDEQVEFAIRSGAGSARDTLSALDQVVAAGGVPDRADGAGALVDAIRASDPGAALAAVQMSVSGGAEPRAVGEDLVETLRDAFLVTVDVEVPHLTPERTEAARELGAELGARPITRALELLGSALIEIRQAADPRIPLEVALLKITTPQSDGSVDGLIDRVARLERAVSEGSGGAAAAPAAAVSKSQPEPRAATPSAATPPGNGPASGARAVLEQSAGSRAKPALGGVRKVDKGSAGSTPPAPSQTSEKPEPSKPASSPQKPTAVADQAPSSAAEGRAEPSEDAGGAPTRDAITLAWGDTILPSLSQKIRSRWSPGRFIDSADGEVIFALPNTVTCDRCAEQQPDVERALSEHFGTRVALRLVVDEDSKPPTNALAPADVVREAGKRAESSIEEVGPVEDLEDAGDGVASGVSRLSDAFPGAELVEVEEET